MKLTRHLPRNTTWRDPEYFHRLVKIAVPIVLQNAVAAGLNMVGVIMIGQLGEASVAGAGLAGQIQFLLFFLLFGTSSGSAVFTAQFWGKGDLPSIRKTQGISLTIGLLGAVIFTAAGLLIPRQLLSIYTTDPQVIDIGSAYLRILAPNFLFLAVSFTYASVLRSTGEVKIPMFVSMITLSLNTLLSYGLIFGRFGLPQLGVNGAAYAVTISRAFDCTLLLLIAYRRRTPAAATLREMFAYDIPFVKRVLSRALPVTINEFLWALGITTYNAVYAHIGTEAIAAVNITGTIESLAFVVFIGVTDATAILVGNHIGAGEEDRAFDYAWKSLRITIAIGVLVGLIVLAGAPLILTFYKVSPLVAGYARRILIVFACTLWIRVSNMNIIVGVLRSGGDTRIGFLIDIVGLWVIGVPLAFAGAFLFHLPVYWVYLMILTEEAVKMGVGLLRFFSGRWITNLAAAD